MRTLTETVDLFLYDELSNSAKVRAAQWYAEASAGDDFWSEYTIEDFATICGFCGWDISTRPAKLMNGTTRYEPSVFWSGFWSQGDGASFQGAWSADRVSVKGLRSHAPKDAELHRIAREFRDIAKRERNATGSSDHCGHYYREYEMNLEFASNREKAERADLADTESAFIEASRDLARWLYKTLETEYEYQFSGEGLRETMMANEYEFTADGVRA